VRRRQPDWTSEVRLQVFYDDDPPAPAADEVATGAQRLPIPVRSCAVVAAVALIPASLCMAYLQYRQHQSTTVTQTSYRHPHGVDLTGCPRQDECVALPSVQVAITAALIKYLPTAVVQYQTLDYDPPGSLQYRTFQVATANRVVVTVTAQCILGAPPVTALTSRVTTRGRADILLVRPARQAGCSVAVTARVPTGVSIPDGALTALAADPSVQLSY
jgi:hypothetical protein